jgi:hypothetical protein
MPPLQIHGIDAFCLHLKNICDTFDKTKRDKMKFQNKTGKQQAEMKTKCWARSRRICCTILLFGQPMRGVAGSDSGLALEQDGYACHNCQKHL